jgi:MoaA/NifB/PqqE/SkfB family radical SAM enzyme
LYTDFVLENYLRDGVAGIIRDLSKISARNPKASIFMLKYALAGKKAAARREAAIGRGEHIPPFLIASVTSACNLHCEGCYARARDLNGCVDHESPAQLSDTEWLGIFEEAKNLGIGFVLVAGGEPLLRKELMVGLGKISDIIFPVFTNGTLINEEYIKLFDKYRNLIPIISIEGHRENTNDRRGHGIYEQVQKAMAMMKKRKIFFGVSITVQSDNLKEACSRALLQTLSESGCKVVFYVEYVPVDAGAETQELEESERAYLERQLTEIRKEFPGMIFISFPGDEKESGGCLAAGRGFFHINFDGSAEPCPFSPYSDTNVRDMTLAEAMSSPLFVKLRNSDMLKQEHTGGCVLFEQEDAVKSLLHL